VRESQAHRIYFPPTNTHRASVIETLNVRFNETAPPEAVLNGNVELLFPVTDDDDDEPDPLQPIQLEGGGPVADADTEPLPDGWFRAENDGPPYYYHTESKTSQWGRPTELSILHLAALAAITTGCAIGQVLKTAKAALDTKYHDDFATSIAAEQDGLYRRNTLVRVRRRDAPTGERVFRSYMLSHRKKQPGTAKGWKAKSRWVFDGSQSVHGEHHAISVAHTPPWVTIRLIIAIAAAMRWCPRNADAPQALLFSRAEHPVYMSAPVGLEERDGDGSLLVYRVDGNMYGRVDAAAIWTRDATEHLHSLGFRASASDPCLFSLEVSHGDIHSRFEYAGAAADGGAVDGGARKRRRRRPAGRLIVALYIDD